MDIRLRPGTRFPVLTAAVALVTAAVSVTGLVVPSVVDALGRNGVLISRGQLWRPVTSLLVQDGGVFGTVSNLLGLVVLGVVAERLCAGLRWGRRAWAVAYLGAGLVGEIVGWAGWQPVGAGNSVAVCGLAGLVVVALLRDGHGPLARVGAIAAGFWASLLLAGVVAPTILVAVLIAAIVVLVNLADAGRLPAVVTPGVIAAVVSVVAAVVLVALADIHGAALAAGLVIAAAITRPAV